MPISDINHFWGNDVGPSATGDLQSVSGTNMGQQRVLRRLMTNPAVYDSFGNIKKPGDYIWHPTYGAGLPAMVGRVVNIPKITGVIRAQMLLESAVSQNPDPQITVNAIQGGVSVLITYNDAFTNAPIVLSFNVTA